MLLPAALDEHDFFDALIWVSWPNAATFYRVLACHATPAIYVVGYDFERRWLSDSSGVRRALRVPSLGRAEKSALVGHADDPTITWPEPPPRAAPVIPSPTEGEFRIWTFEEKIARKGIARPAADGEDVVSATFVSFIGDAYAYLTASNKLPVITELLAGSVGEQLTRFRDADLNKSTLATCSSFAKEANAMSFTHWRMRGWARRRRKCEPWLAGGSGH